MSFIRANRTLVTGFTALLIGCGGVATDPVTPSTTALPPPGANGEYHPRLPQPGPGDARYLALNIAPAPRCGLEKAPKFPFDKARMLAQYRKDLVRLADCLQRSALKDATVYVVGYADPRGSDDYNYALGKRRAEYVKNFLIKEGVDEDRLVVRSDGEKHAKGQRPEYAYGYDRRVEVHVKDADFGKVPRHDANVRPVGGL